MYSFECRVRYSEVDSNGCLNLHGIMDYFQDCSSFHSEDLGVGISFLKKHSIAWILVTWQVEVERYPAYGEKIKVGTWPSDFKGIYGTRSYVMEDEKGQQIARANSLWVLMDLEKGRPSKALPEILEAYDLEPELSMEKLSRKMALPECLEPQEPFLVKKYHLDTNQHVNNGKYILMAQEYLPEGVTIEKLRVEYRKSALFGDIIYPQVAEEKGKTTVVLKDEQDNPYVVTEMTWK